MADYYQNGVITTLHNFTNRPVDALEDELMRFRKKNGINMSLVLPSLYSELETPALAQIVDELSKVKYLEEIVIGLDRSNKEQFQHAKRYFARLNQNHRILWNDGERLQELDQELQEHGLAPREMGKGRNVWYCFGYILATGKAKTVALHDCDIVTYEREMLARLMYPVANPAFSFEFCKGYYARWSESKKLNGRVCRLLVTPLLKALKKTHGRIDYLEYLDSFRYALAGEFSMEVDVLKDLRIPSDWGLEIGVLSELYHHYSPNHLCQVDIADMYDHKHQELSADDANKGLRRMATDISKAIFRKLATRGVTFSTETFRSIKATYFRVALDFVESYYKDAMMNGLVLDRHAEEESIELFAQCLMEAGEHFLSNPMERPFMPNWNRVLSAVPDFLERLREAVELDNRD